MVSEHSKHHQGPEAYLSGLEPLAAFRRPPSVAAPARLNRGSDELFFGRFDVKKMVGSRSGLIADASRSMKSTNKTMRSSRPRLKIVAHFGISSNTQHTHDKKDQTRNYCWLFDRIGRKKA
ncbi:uncharacterized protein J3R85_000244 [Psidium guajava]|nr:uncharacterized protein J3R85_000244 [Psidium guajava]